MQHQNMRNEEPRRNRRESGVAFAVLTHAIRMAVSLAPLIILEIEPNPTRAHRLIKGASIIGTGLSETLWAARVQQRRNQHQER